MDEVALPPAAMIKKGCFSNAHSSCRVLVVDDSPTVLKLELHLLRRALKMFHLDGIITVDTAKDGDEAAQKIDAISRTGEIYALILIDIRIFVDFL